MPRKTVEPRFEYKVVRAELWGNAKDGFDTNNWHVIERIQTTEQYSQKTLLSIARNYFEGSSFAWNEDKSRPMSRKGIEITHMEDVMMYWGQGPMPIASCQIEYRGHYVGEIQLIQLEPIKSVSIIEE